MPLSTMDAAYYRDLYDYDHSGNRRLLDALRDLSSLEERTHSVFAHILATKKVWITRLRGEDASPLSIWPELTWDECASRIDENHRAYTAFLEGRSGADLTQEAVYENSKGIEFHTPIRDILTHVLVHGGHHRGQIAQDMRRQGAEPLNTDYITHVRSS